MDTDKLFDKYIPDSLKRRLMRINLWDEFKFDVKDRWVNLEYSLIHSLDDYILGKTYGWDGDEDAEYIDELIVWEYASYPYWEKVYEAMCKGNEERI